LKIEKKKKKNQRERERIIKEGENDGSDDKEEARDGEREGHAGSSRRSTTWRVRSGPVR